MGDDEKKRAKGVREDCEVKKTLRHEHYKDILFSKRMHLMTNMTMRTEEILSRKDLMHMIRSDKHELYTVVQNKTSLSSFDDTSDYLA